MDWLTSNFKELACETGARNKQRKTVVSEYLSLCFQMGKARTYLHVDCDLMNK